MNFIEIKEVLKHKQEFITIDDFKEYKRCRVQLHNKGIKLRDIIKGGDIKTKKQQLCKEGQFLVAEIDAKVGGYGIVPNDLDGAIVSSHYYLYDIIESKLDKNYFSYYLKTHQFFSQIKAQGSTNYASIRPNDVLKIRMPLPSINEQKEIALKLESVFNTSKSFLENLSKNFNSVNILRQSILQEAVQGRLVPQDPNEEPASELIKKIKAEKEKLIKEGKIKKQKPLPPITEEEIPYELPKGWEWVRLGEIITIKGGKRVPKGYELLKEPTSHIYIRVSDMKDDTIYNSDLRYISDDIYEMIKQYIIEEDDLYITIAGTIGQVGVVPKKFHGMNLTENAARMIIYEVDKFLLKYFLSSSFIQNQFFVKTNQMAQPKLALKRIASTELPLPPLNEQKRIVEKIDSLMKLCDGLEKNIEQSKKDSELLMQAVLQEAFWGIEKTNKSKTDIPQKNVVNETAIMASTGSYNPNWIAYPSKWPIINLQLTAWCEANDKYDSIKVKGEYNWGDIIPVINLLGDSLSHLFGMNYNKDGQTPPLYKFINDYLPSRGWDLKSENPELYKDFLKLDKFYKNITKHIASYKTREASEITFDELSYFMDTTRKLWIWFLNKIYNGIIPDEQLVFFDKEYLK